jgi:hypothetical protein
MDTSDHIGLTDDHWCHNMVNTIYGTTCIREMVIWCTIYNIISGLFCHVSVWLLAYMDQSTTHSWSVTSKRLHSSVYDADFVTSIPKGPTTFWLLGNVGEIIAGSMPFD